MFLEFLFMVLALDLGSLVAWLLLNLHWFFMFYFLIYIFMDGEAVVKPFLLFLIILFAFVDFEAMSGLVVFSASFLFLYYAIKMVVILFGENTPYLKNKLFMLSAISGYLVMALYNIFLV